MGPKGRVAPAKADETAAARIELSSADKDKDRIKNHSVKLLKYFRPILYHLRAIGKFPFSTSQLEDGSLTFWLKYCSFWYIWFVFMTIITVSLFLAFSFGLIHEFMHLGNDNLYKDRCGNSWTKTVIHRNLPMIFFVWTCMLISTSGSLHILCRGKSFVQFYNVANEAVMQMDADPFHGLFRSEIISFIAFILSTLIFVLLSIIRVIKSLEETVVFIVHCMVNPFSMEYIVYQDAKPFLAKDYEDLLSKCDNLCQGCLGSDPDTNRCKANNCFNMLNKRSSHWDAAYWCGLVIAMYSIFGARAILSQFAFFAQVLANLIQIWNKRFTNYAADNRTVQIDDRYRRRLSNEHVLKDHWKIVCFIDALENCFSSNLFVYYGSMFFNFVCQFYYITMLTTQMTCAIAVQGERSAALAGKCFTGTANNSIVTGVINNTKEVLEAGFEADEIGRTVSHEDACSDPKIYITHAKWLTVFILLQCYIQFLVTTYAADNIAIQCQDGFRHVIRRGYLPCKTYADRQAMRHLVFSFTGPRSFCITAAGFFPLRKSAIVVITSVALIYFLIISGFKPGVNTPRVRCFQTRNITDQYNRTIEIAEVVLKYPGII